jgi:DNA-binding MarR family transcriptional regulator
MIDKLSDFFPFLMLVTVRAMVRKINQLFAQHQIDLTAEQFAILNILSPDFNLMTNEISQQDLADFLDKDKSAVLRSLDILERKSYIERRAKISDRRVNLIFLTELGQLILNKARAVDIEFVAKVSNKFNLRDFEGFKKVLQQINDNCIT